MTAATGIWNNTGSSANPLMSAKAMDNSSNGSNNSSTSSATITANDFLTLLVTEMQNQDPTANTDPNEYINQLVNVNSLEQLININQTLSTAYPSTSTNGSSQAVTSQTGVTSAAAAQKGGAHNSAGAAHATNTNAIAAPQTTPGSAPATTTYGNLGAQHVRPAALRVARALDGQHITR